MNLACTLCSSKTPGLSFFHSLLTSYTSCQNLKATLDLFRQLLETNVNPIDLTFSLLIKACASFPARIEGCQVHTQLVKRGVNEFLYVNTALLDFYMKLGCTNDARKLFEDMPFRDVVSWNALICGYSQNGYHIDALDLFVQMLRLGFRPNQTTIVSLIPSCGLGELIRQGRSIHGLGIKAGLGWDLQVKNALTSMYAKCDDLKASEFLFEEMSEKNIVSWNTMIGAYGQNGFSDKAMVFFKKMLEESLQPSPVTMMSLLSLNVVPEIMHCYIIKSGLINYISVITSLVCLYAKKGCTDMAELLSKTLPMKNLISLTAIMSSYCEKGDIKLVIEYFMQIQQLDMKPDAVTMISVLHGIIDPAHLVIGRAFHSYGLKSGLIVDCLVVNGLISMYSRFDEIEDAFSLFVEMNEKPLITWNSLISGFVQSGKPSHAMELFRQMKMSGQKPDGITIASLLSGCGQLGYLRIGEALQNYVLRNNVKVEDFTGTALIDMYTKCGRLEYAERVFKSINNPCLATWNSIISGYSLHGLGHKAFSFYAELLERGLKPDRITFLGVLAGCTHGGLVREGTEHFLIMTKEYGLLPDLQHCASMVGLLGRAGLFKEAMEFINNMEVEPDSAVWGALLSACCIHQEVKLGECLAKKLFFLNNKNGGFYVLMSNLYAIAGKWDDVARVRDMMIESGGDGCLGVSVIQVASVEDINNSALLGEVYSNTNTRQYFY